jgi:hypothetical protein
MSASFQNGFVLFLTVLFAGLLPFTSCASGGGPRKTVPPAVFKSGQRQTADTAFVIHTEELRIPLWRDLPPALTAKDSPALTMDLKLIDFAASPTRSLEQLFNSTLYRGLSAQDYARELVRVQTIEYQEMGEEARNNSFLVNSATLNWEYSERLETPVNGSRLLVISRERNSYTGGAHPSHDKTYFVFDLEAATLVRLSDIALEESMPALKQLVNRELRAGKKLGPQDSLKKALFFVDEAELSENFFFSPRGLGFHWDPYEIAPYSEGYVEAIVPFGEITAFLSPGGRRLAGELRKE